MPQHNDLPSNKTPDWNNLARAPLGAQLLPPHKGEPALQPQPASPARPAWPQSPARLGEFYGAEDPNHPGQDIIVMSQATWLQTGTIMESLRQLAKKQDARIKELLADLAVRDLRTKDAEDRLNNLREARRREKRAELEGSLITPGDSRFTTKGK